MDCIVLIKQRLTIFAEYVLIKFSEKCIAEIILISWIFLWVVYAVLMTLISHNMFEFFSDHVVVHINAG